MNNGAVLGVTLFLKQPAERVAIRVCEMFRAQQRIAECQPRRDAIFMRQRQHLARGAVTVLDPAAHKQSDGAP